MWRWNDKRQDMFNAVVEWLKSGSEELYFKVSKKDADIEEKTNKIFGRLSKIWFYEKEFEWETRYKFFLWLEDKEPIQLTWWINKLTVNLINNLVNLTEEHVKHNITISLYIKDWYKNVSLWWFWGMIMWKYKNEDVWSHIVVEKNSKGRVVDVDYSWFIKFIKDDVEKLNSILPNFNWWIEETEEDFGDMVDKEAKEKSNKKDKTKEKITDNKDEKENLDDDLPF